MQFKEDGGERLGVHAGRADLWVSRGRGNIGVKRQVLQTKKSGGYLFVGKLGGIRALARVFHGDGQNLSALVQVQ